MENLKIPEGYQYVMPYLIVKNAAGLLSFAQQVFNAREKMKHMRDENHIMHAEMQIGNSTIMFADSNEQWTPQNAGLFVYVPNVDEAYQKALSLGARSIQEPNNQDYGRTSGVADPFGNVWWITSPN